jgi:hypothetical protein
MLELGKGSREECGRGMVCHDEGLASSQGKQRFSSESVRSRESLDHGGRTLATLRNRPGL